MTNLQSFYGLYKALDKGVEENLMEIFEYLGLVQPLISTWVSSDFLEMSRYVSDDTTSGRAFELQKQAKMLGDLVDELLESYLGVTEEEAEKLRNGAKAICENLAVIHFSTDNYSDYLDSIQKNTFSLETIEMTPYVAEVVTQGAAALIEDVRTTVEILSKFAVYLPEYTLTEDELDNVIEYLEAGGRGSYEIGIMKRSEVRKGLGYDEE